MLVTSFKFLIFFLVFFILYWLPISKGSRWYQNILLLCGSIAFYIFTDFQMLPLIVVSTIVFYFLGVGIEKNEDKILADIYKYAGILMALSLLVYFKYNHFFISSFVKVFGWIGLHVNMSSFKVLIPLGLSYYVFKMISYLIEIYRGKISASRDMVAFAAYISFFPTISAGPIDRPNTFLSQLSQRRVFKYEMGVDGIRQILWGVFKKCVVADFCAVHFVDEVWMNIGGCSSLILFAAMFVYAFQVYCDFSGYSDIAIGISKLLGIKVTKNFNHPFFATNIAEFWRRWHISLTGWLTDYVFLPLNMLFRNMNKFGVFLAIMINMILVGMWHGECMRYVYFGIFHGLLFAPLVFSGKMNKKEKEHIGLWGLPSLTDFMKMLGVFSLYSLSTCLYRAEDMEQLYAFFNQMLSFNVANNLNGPFMLTIMATLFLLVMLLEWYTRKKDFPLQSIDSLPIYVRFVFYALILVSFMFLAPSGSPQFIYQQF